MTVTSNTAHTCEDDPRINILQREFHSPPVNTVWSVTMSLSPFVFGELKILRSLSLLPLVPRVQKIKCTCLCVMHVKNSNFKKIEQNRGGRSVLGIGTWDRYLGSVFRYSGTTGSENFYRLLKY